MKEQVQDQDSSSTETVKSQGLKHSTGPFDRPVTGLVRFTMYRDLKVLPGDLPLTFGYRLESWCEPLIPAYGAALAVAFSDSPDVEVFPRLASKEGCISIVEEIADLPDFIPSASWLVFFNREPCGLVLTGRAEQKGIGRIRIVGVAPRHRGAGVASYLVNKALWSFRDRRFTYGSVRVSRTNRNAIRFFRRRGFQVVASDEINR